MRIVLDNNVVIDALSPNAEFEANAKEILQFASVRKVEGFVGANSLTDIFYVLRKRHGADKAKAIIRKLLLILDIIAIEPGDCIAALDKPMSDFEDALVDVCARKAQADYIITRDAAFLKCATDVKTIAPADWLALLKQG